MPIRDGWSNWSGELACTPRARVRAMRVEDVRAAVRHAADLGVPLRTAGTGHSFSPLCPTDGVLLTLDGLTGIRDVDLATGHVTVAAGTPLHRLGPLLATHGLAQPNLGDIDAQTIAGATATATHGTGLRHPPLSSQVEAVELIDAEGELRTLRATDRDDPDVFAAAQASLGLLGVVTAVTLRCVPAFTLRSTEELWPLDRAYAEATDAAAREDHWELWAFPHAHHALTHAMTRVDGPPAPPHPVVTQLRSVVLANHLFGAVQRLGRARPALVPQLNRVVTRVAPEPPYTDASHRVFANPRRVRFTEMEVAVPAEHAAEALARALAAAESCEHPVSFPVQLRFSAPDEALVGPAHGRPSAFVAVHAYRGTPWRQYFRRVWDALRELDGRPHWGKRHFLTPEDVAEVHPGWTRFAAVRARMDPERRFVSTAVAETLGL